MKYLLKFKFFILTYVCVLLFSCKPNEPAEVPDHLPSNIITKIVIDKQGVKWISTDKGLVSFDGVKWKSYASISAFSDGMVADLSFDKMSTSNQDLWVSTLQGVYKCNISSRDLTLSSTYHRETLKLMSDTVYSVVTDMKNAKFFGTPKGLSIFKNDKWISYEGYWSTKKDDFLKRNPITAIASAQDGWNYVSTKGGGVSRFKLNALDAVTGATKFFMPWAFGLKTDTVFTVIVVNDTCQWYGTTKGVSLHTRSNTKLGWETSYSTIDGLASDTVYAIAEGVNKDMWFGTHRGISHLSNSGWTNYTTKNGLIGQKVNTIAVDIDSSVWVGTDKGISHLKEGVWKSFFVNE